MGWLALPFLLLQALYAASMLEVVNYVEHYGLLRQQDASGRFVRCEPEHSWNSNHLVSNILLFHLQRHSDHHAHAERHYQSLRNFEEAPQLPTGYMGMLLLSYVPSLYFAVMDPRLLTQADGDLDRVVHEREQSHAPRLATDRSAGRRNRNRDGLSGPRRLAADLWR